MGADHHYALICLTDLATVAAEAGEPAAAREFGEQALTGLRAVLGADHPHALACAANLALDRHAGGRSAAADELSVRTLDSYRRTLGADHPEAQAAHAGERLVIDFDPPEI